MDYIATEGAPKAIGPYSQAVRAGNLIFTSGQIPLDPQTGKLVEGEFEVHARRVFENLKAVLSAAGASFADVARATVYLASLGDFQVLNEVYGEYFGEHKPARSTFAVAQLPMGASLEIDLIAVAK
jgi:2-iminobutanoate/2-iminopropanoate deaminase